MRIKLKASTCPNNSTVPGYHSLLSLEILSSRFIMDGILTEGAKFALNQPEKTKRLPDEGYRTLSYVISNFPLLLSPLQFSVSMGIIWGFSVFSACS